MNTCKICPRYCDVDRSLGLGFCRETNDLRLAWVGLHFGEEPPITCIKGSGTIFITGCNLRCAFCQNYQISQEGMGTKVSPKQFASLCLKLQNLHAENINIVTGSHAVSTILEGLRIAKKEGLTIPICWNSSSYETIEAIDALSELVDIWLPDMKTLNQELALAAFAAKNYPNVAQNAIQRMVEHTPLVIKTECDDEGNFYDKMYSGTIVRHLVIPGRLADTRAVLEWFDAHLKGRALLSLMTQYTPVSFGEAEAERQNRAFSTFENRYLSDEEYKELIAMLDERDDESGFFQELVQDNTWLPDFNRRQPFSSELAQGVWHWKYGLLKN